MRASWKRTLRRAPRPGATALLPKRRLSLHSARARALSFSLSLLLPSRPKILHRPDDVEINRQMDETRATDVRTGTRGEGRGARKHLPRRGVWSGLPRTRGGVSSLTASDGSLAPLVAGGARSKIPGRPLAARRGADRSSPLGPSSPAAAFTSLALRRRRAGRNARNTHSRSQAGGARRG